MDKLWGFIPKFKYYSCHLSEGEACYIPEIDTMNANFDCNVPDMYNKIIIDEEYRWHPSFNCSVPGVFLRLWNTWSIKCLVLLIELASYHKEKIILPLEKNFDRRPIIKEYIHQILLSELYLNIISVNQKIVQEFGCLLLSSLKLFQNTFERFVIIAHEKEKLEDLLSDEPNREILQEYYYKYRDLVLSISDDYSKQGFLAQIVILNSLNIRPIIRDITEYDENLVLQLAKNNHDLDYSTISRFMKCIDYLEEHHEMGIDYFLEKKWFPIDGLDEDSLALKLNYYHEEHIFDLYFKSNEKINHRMNLSNKIIAYELLFIYKYLALNHRKYEKLVSELLPEYVRLSADFEKLFKTAPLVHYTNFSKNSILSFNYEMNLLNNDLFNPAKDIGEMKSYYYFIFDIVNLWFAKNQILNYEDYHKLGNNSIKCAFYFFGRCKGLTCKVCFQSNYFKHNINDYFTFEENV
ncbi:hypothetical protein GF406_05460 [candidate division KSB1 bacterium]|nr:hypothetical protein [candidate division KSB1 bacterium]